MNDAETYEFEGRYYNDPQVSLNEKNTFIDNLRQVQQQNNSQINTDTYNLGTRVPSNTGGLTGSSSYFTSRYQTPYINSTVANLRAAAQADALSQYYNNWKNQAQKRYQDAQNAYNKRAYNSSRRSGSGGGSGVGTIPYYTYEPEGGGKDYYDANDGDTTASITNTDYSVTNTYIPGRRTISVVQDGDYLVQDIDTGEILYRNGKRVGGSTNSNNTAGRAGILDTNPLNGGFYGR